MIRTELQTSYDLADELHDLFDLDVRVSVPETVDSETPGAEPCFTNPCRQTQFSICGCGHTQICG